MCQNAGIMGHKTNHSLRATCATRLFEHNVDEQLIMNRTAGVRSYKRVSDIHHYNMSIVIDNESIKKLKTENNSTFNFSFKEGCNVVINNYNNSNIS